MVSLVVTGLKGDPRRQAKDSLRGYVYQILRSIEVWLDLDDREQLYLEGAEDLDRISDDGASTEQVKDTAGSGNITMRSASVIEAINNFWTHTVRNAGTTVRFRFVTTSGIGVEQGNPFGFGQSGIELWNALRAAPDSAGEDDIRSIMTFLNERETVAATVRDFLAAATPSHVLNKLIEPIEWLAGQHDGTALVRRIKDRLVEHGNTVHVAPVDAELAFDSLYAAAFCAATSKDDIPLTRAEFLRIFASATSVSLPKQDLVALVHAVMAPAPGSGLTVQARSLAFEGPPPLPARYFSRLLLEQQVVDALDTGAALLFGSTGSGKTLMAASALADRSPIWLTLRDLTPAETKSWLVVARDLLRSDGVARTIVIDDLNALDDPRLVESALATLWQCQKDLGGQLVVTADRILPARLAQAIELEPSRELQMQPFDYAEISAFLEQSGCPDAKLSPWAKFLELSTLGHPQLLNARVASLSAANFPGPDFNELVVSPPEIDRIRFEARRIIADLPDGARELLYRSSLLTGRINRQRLMAIARISPAIVEPGTAIDIITGPWLEQADDREFRVSPLARGSAEHARGLDWIKPMHGQLAWTYIADRVITPWDISSVLVHCFIAGHAGPLVYIMQSVLSASEEAWASIAEACEMYAMLALGPEEALPFKRSADLFVFRIFQYRIAAETNPDIAMRVAAKVETELKANAGDDVAQFFRFLYLGQLLSVLKVKYPIAFIVVRACEFFEVAQALETSLPDRMTKAGLSPDEEMPDGSYSQAAALRLLAHLQDIEDFAALIDALKARPPDEARALLESMGDPDDMASVLIERFWLAEYRGNLGHWAEFRAKLRSALDFAVERDGIKMVRAIAPVLVRVIDEDLNDPPGAIAEAEELDTVVDNDPIFRCAMAKVIGRTGDYPRARAIWIEALPRWPKLGDDLGAAFAYRSAAIAAGHADAWEDAAEFLARARDLVADGDRLTFTLGLTMDAAFSRFMAGDRATAVIEFAQIVTVLDPLQPDLEREPLLSLQRRAGGVLSALAEKSEGKGVDIDLHNLVGLCSNLDPFVTQASVAPPLDTLRMDLIRLELVHGATLEGALREAPKLRQSPIISFRAAGAVPLFQLAQRTRDFGEILGDGLRQLDALAATAEQLANNDRDVMRHDDGKRRDWAPGADEIVIGNLVIALFDLAAANELDRMPLDQWRADAARHHQTERIIRLIDHLDGLFVSGNIDAWATVLNCPSADWSLHIASSLAAHLLERLAPDALIYCHGLWASYLSQPHLRSLAAMSVERLVSRRWRAMTRVPAVFVSSKTSIPRLQAALDGEAEGWAKTSEVLQAALDGVPLPTEDTTRLAIERLRG